jgi:hypothetical protein
VEPGPTRGCRRDGPPRPRPRRARVPRLVGPSVDHRRDPGRPRIPRGREADQHQRRPQRLPLLLAGRRFDRLLYAPERLDGDRGPGSGAGGGRGGAHERRDAERPARLLARRSADRLSLGGARRDLAHSRARRRGPPADLIRVESDLVAGRVSDRLSKPALGGLRSPRSRRWDRAGRAPRRGRPTAG